MNKEIFGIAVLACIGNCTCAKPTPTPVPTVVPMAATAASNEREGCLTTAEVSAELSAWPDLSSILVLDYRDPGYRQPYSNRLQAWPQANSERIHLLLGQGEMDAGHSEGWNQPPLVAFGYRCGKGMARAKNRHTVHHELTHAFVDRWLEERFRGQPRERVQFADTLRSRIVAELKVADPFFVRTIDLANAVLERGVSFRLFFRAIKTLEEKLEFWLKILAVTDQLPDGGAPPAAAREDEEKLQALRERRAAVYGRLFPNDVHRLPLGDRLDRAQAEAYLRDTEPDFREIEALAAEANSLGDRIAARAPSLRSTPLRMQLPGEMLRFQQVHLKGYFLTLPEILARTGTAILTCRGAEAFDLEHYPPTPSVKTFLRDIVIGGLHPFTEPLEAFEAGAESCTRRTAAHAGRNAIFGTLPYED